MTLIEDMSEPERQSWITLLADGAVFVYFMKQMTGGWSLTPIDYGRSEVAGVFASIVILTIVLHTVIAIIFEIRKNKDGLAKDERDQNIARAGNRNAYWLMQAGVGVLVVTLLIQFVVGDAYMGPISVIKPVEMIFGLAFVSYVSDLVKHATILLGYRGA